MQSILLLNRIAIGKLTGFLFGLLGFFMLPYLMDNPDLTMRWGILLWYPTVGAIIAAFSVIDYHPVLRLPMRWWLMAGFVGAWMNFLLSLMAYEPLEKAMLAMFGVDGLLKSPFWFVVEGAIIGWIIGFAIKQCEGKFQFFSH